MSIVIDEKYILLFSNKLQQFKKVDNNYNCRCPLCGDSKKNKFKTRGYFLRGDTGFGFFCQNCSASLSFGQLIEKLDPELFQEYNFENFKHKTDFSWDEPKPVKKEFEEPTVKKNTGIVLKTLIPVCNLPDGHKCKEYVRKRKIPEKFWNILYYTENYMKWITEHVVINKFEKYPKTDPRLVIPFFTKTGEPFAYQGRTLSEDPNVLRYITIHQEEKNVLIYGLERVDFKKTVYVVEGPIDSLFLENAIAVAGSSLKKLLKVDSFDGVFVFDNQSRSPEIVKLLQNLIDTNKRVVIFPKHITQKDINDMVLKGRMAINEVQNVVADNAYRGLRAQLKFNEWKEI